MKRVMMAVAMATSMLVPVTAVACEGADHQAAAPKKVTVNELASLTKVKKATPVDANGKEVRTNQGIIPGAVMLTSSTSYDVKELPEDKNAKLVFYCASEMCGASHQAAAKALQNGYTDVSVLPEGIKGWKAAGQATSKPNS